MPDVADNFNRVDGASQLANRSDGGFWVVPSNNDMVISGGKLARTLDGLPVVQNAWLYVDYDYHQTVSVSFDFVQTSTQGQVYAWVAIDTSRLLGYEIHFDPGFPRVAVKSFPADSDFATAVTPTWSDGVTRRMTIAYNYVTGVITVSVDGTNYITATVPGTPSPNTGFALLYNRKPASAGCYFDNVSLTGTGIWYTRTSADVVGLADAGTPVSTFRRTFNDLNKCRDSMVRKVILGQTVQLDQSAANAIFNPRPTGQ